MLSVTLAIIIGIVIGIIVSRLTNPDPPPCPTYFHLPHLPQTPSLPQSTPHILGSLLTPTTPSLYQKYTIAR